MHPSNYDEPWYECEDRRELEDACRRTIERVVRANEWREGKFLDRLRVYYAGSVGSIEDVRAGRIAMFTGSAEESRPDCQLRHSASAVDTAVSRIGAKQKPKPVLQTYGADYTSRMEAKRISKFLLGQFRLPQGRWADTWQVLLQVLWDAAVFGGCVWEQENLEEERTDTLRVLPIDVFFDEDDSADGNPSQVWRREAVDRCALRERVEAMLSAPTPEPMVEEDNDDSPGMVEAPEEEDESEDEYDDTVETLEEKCKRLCDAIDSAEARTSSKSFTESASNEIWVWHCYRRKTSKRSTGRYVVCLSDGTVLDDKPFNSRRLPCAVVNWTDPVSGMWGDTMTDLQEVPQQLANDSYGNIRDNLRVNSGGMIFVRGNSVEADATGRTLEDILSNLNFKVVRYNGETPPQYETPPVYNPQVLEAAERFRQFAFEIPGINELAAQSRKEPGVNSGVGIRNSNELQDQRFLKQARMFESLHTVVGHLKVDAVQRLDEMGIKAKVWLPSEGLVRDIDWHAIRPDGEDLYTISIEAGNAMVDNVGQRQQFIDELRASGQIPPEVANRLMFDGNPDLEAYNNRVQGQYNWIERIIGEVHDAGDDEDIQTEPPDPTWDMPLAAMQVKQAYHELSSWPDAPDNKRAALRDLYTLILDAMAQATQQNQAPGGATMPGQQPTAPTGGPMTVGPGEQLI